MEIPSILLVEDNPDDVELTLLAFEQSKIKNRIVVANDGVEALRYLLPEDDTPPLRPAVVLLDLKIPKIDGLEVLRRLRADPRGEAQPVIVLTSSKEERDIADSYHLGSNSYVRKPVLFAELVEAVRVLGLFWLMINISPHGQRLTPSIAGGLAVEPPAAPG